jgi:transposase
LISYAKVILQPQSPTASRHHLAHISRNRGGKPGLEQWKAAVRASGIAELVDFVEGLADDAEAVVNGCTESWNNGMVEGFVNKVKWIKRSSYGQAGFPLLQRRVLLHPASRAPHHEDETLAA